MVIFTDGSGTETRARRAEVHKTGRMWGLYTAAGALAAIARDLGMAGK